LLFVPFPLFITTSPNRTKTDSIYGARHLANKMSRTKLPGGVTELKAIDVFVLLDLLGAKQPQITSSFDNTRDKFDALASVERRLARANLLRAHTAPYFRLERVSFLCVFFLIFLMFWVSPRPQARYGTVEDDHVPFLQRGVPILHVIPRPFPDVWHTGKDNERALDEPTMHNLALIFRVFVVETLQLPIK
jgi:glutaminyl-peptide cyclotransferase